MFFGLFYQQSTDTLEPVKQISFVPLAVGAIFALAEAARQAHAVRCSGVPGVCPNLVTEVRTGDILQRLSNIQVGTHARAPAHTHTHTHTHTYTLLPHLVK